FPPPLVECLIPKHLQSLNVLWVHAGQPCVARDLGSPLRKTVDRCVTWRNLPYFYIGVISEGSDETRSSRQRALSIHIGECLLCPLSFRNIAGHAKQSHGSSLGIAHNRTLHRNPARLTGVQVARWGHHSVFSVPDATGALCLCEGSVYARKVVGMNEAPRL